MIRPETFRRPATLAKNLDAAPGLGSNGPKSARSAIVTTVNGERGRSSPQRQGLHSAVFGEGSPLGLQQSLSNCPTVAIG